MQTFVPYPDFDASAHALDTRRLGKQRVEVIQIVRALTVPSYAWKSHPAVLMWQGYEEALGAYGMAVTRVWRERGFADTCAATIVADLAAAGVTTIRSQAELADAGALPPWLGDDALHRSHQSALVRKDPAYRERFPEVPDALPYLWPVRAPGVVDADRRREEAAARRIEREAARAERQREALARKRSRAAKKAARTRRANNAARAAEARRTTALDRRRAEQGAAPPATSTDRPSPAPKRRCPDR